MDIDLNSGITRFIRAGELDSRWAVDAAACDGDLVYRKSVTGV